MNGGTLGEYCGSCVAHHSTALSLTTRDPCEFSRAALMKNDNIPFSKFTGKIKKIDTEYLGSIGRRFFQTAFPEFEGLQEISKFMGRAKIEYILREALKSSC